MLNRIAVLSFALVCAVIAPAYADGVPWTSDYNAALSTARQSHKMLLVDFYTDW